MASMFLYVVLFQDEITYPGIVFYENPRLETLTAKETIIDHEEELGISISIPENSIGHEEIVEVVIQPSFSGAFAAPMSMEPVSPAYFIRARNDAKLEKDVTVRIQHYASIETEKDFKDLVFMRANSASSYWGPLFGSIYIFHEVDGKNVKFSLENGQFGEVKTNHFSAFMIWRRKKKKGKCIQSL